MKEFHKWFKIFGVYYDTTLTINPFRFYINGRRIF